MPRSPEDVCDAILRAYFERRCATARALNERSGIESTPEELPWSQALVQCHERDKLLLQWLCSGNAPSDFRRQMSRRVLVAWLLEWLSETQPHRVLDLLQFDMHHLHVLQFSSILAKSRPLGIDPMSLAERTAFKDGLVSVFWRPRTQNTKYPEPAELLRLFRRLTERFQQDQPLPTVEGMDEPWKSSVADAMSYGSEELEKLVTRARMGWFALPAELADGFARCQADGFEPMMVMDKVAGSLEDIAQHVEAGKHEAAATVLLSCLFSSAGDDPYDAARKALDKARKVLQGVPEVFYFDHRDWGALDSAPVKRAPHALAFSHIAQLEGITAEEITALGM